MARDAVKISKDLDDNAIGNVIYVNLSDGTDALAINADGSVNTTINNASIVVTATDLDIRDLTHVAGQDSVQIGDGTEILLVNADGSINVTINNASIAVTATDLDIRDLSHTQDSVKVGDGTDFLAVNADGSINVVVAASTPGTPVVDYDEAAALASAASDNHDYTASGGAFRPTKIKVSAESIATFLIQTGPVGTLVSRGKIRTSVEEPNAEFEFAVGFSIADTEIVRIVRTNDSNKAKDVNSTICGQQD